jgi:ABC-2 type transport system permease protein
MRADLEAQSLGRIRRVGFQAIVRRELGRIIRIWGQTLVPPAVTAALYFVIFGSLIGRRIGQMDGVDYTQYIAPGLIMMAVISNSYANVVSSFFGAKFGKHIEELLVAPLPNWLIVLGYVVGGLMRGLGVGVVVTLVALFFTHVPVAHPLLVGGSVVLTAVVFSLGGFFNAIFAKNFDQISWFPTFVLTPLIYLGGVFYSVSLLPAWAETLSYVNPILYMVNAFRHGFLGTSDVDPGFAFVIMGAFAAVMYAIVVALMNRGVGIRD